ncbi:bifunctional heptose 7-phosphate kinase/heptose 1-phosphate adenyltransferase [Roseococcus sp. XZZS9]|uniref:Bifunctional heptose 7-phosphate kinase/heptose 1-phosphate adenyltransferase n=1 Tax=Roseococcus pinisoli TaxID=2835040 RepID=A0ABS5QAJ1_9PROT|nr:bifunctional heptose 7-phosphate kinase/heptose 1-phosphate adenyltransferase [Roseococcus pinisoli]
MPETPSSPIHDAATPAQLSEAVRGLARGTVLVVGDAMVDRYVYGTVDRVSPEAPVPILTVEREVALPGGAGNVVRNLTALGAAVAFVSVVGDDQAGSDLTGLIGGQPRVEPWLLVQGGRATTMKTRFVAGGQHLLRTDREQSAPIHPRLADRLVKIASDAVAATTTLVLSDYRKGVLAGDIPARLIASAKAAGRRIVVDPKGGDHGRFAGADLIIPEPAELAGATGMPVHDEASVAAAASALRRAHSFGAVLVPRAPEGLTLLEVEADGTETIRHFRAEASEVHDPAGGGDAVVAVVAAGMATGLSLASVARLAALALGIVSRKSGIAPVRAEELLEGLTPGRGAARKLVSLPLAAEVIERWKHRGWRIGLLQVNGEPCPPALTEQARRWCDRLLVGVAGEGEAADSLAERPEVDLVAIGADSGGEELLRLLRPDVLVASHAGGGELAALLREWGGEVRVTP